MKVLVCGGRDLDKFKAYNILERDLKDAISFAELEFGPLPFSIDTLIHGGATGADEGAANWGLSERAKVHEFKANWKKFGKAAGPIRNRQMLEQGNPDVVIALPGGRGTANMVKQAKDAGVPVIRLPIGS